ncbi:glycosyltransferase family 1 protein [Hymenobacter sediminis]|uniref:glycosyltransferase n=1 Tax=Hymenobacter sediminis TaxID=2218621 RepID=UPI000DA69378|nr:glycosyltransferase [Hymenobacter sediminis]RPD45035.1 glycosyltransferase family 1 protein [Hymenobacter sediminis]
MESILHGRDIVVVGQQPWDTEIGSNCKNIALEFARHNRVLYVNSPLDRNTVLKHRREARIQQRLRVIRGEERALEVVDENLWVLTPDSMVESINWLPPSPVYTVFNKLNNRRFAASIQSGIQALGFQDFVLFNDNDIFRSFYLKELLKPAVSVYYSRDYMLAVDYWRKHGRHLEPQLIAKSDVCVANSSYLASYCQRYNPNSYYVGQGCDVAPTPLASPEAAPADLAGIRGPIIGYVGALVSLRLDIKLLQAIAEQRPNWSLVLVGPEDEEFRASALHKLPNVHFLGPKKPEELPAYIRQFAVCLNPQLVNDMTIGNYPRKIDEYLALGKPVVATRTQAMDIFAEHTYLAESAADYVRLIEQALWEDSAELQHSRAAFAATHTWENSVRQIYEAIRTVAPTPTPGPDVALAHA